MFPLFESSASMLAVNTRSDIAVYSFVSGVILSILVPVLVPVIIG